MYYVSNGKAYVKTENGFAEIEIRAKYKVIKTSEIESVSVIPVSEPVESLENPQECTIEEITAQLGVKEETDDNISVSEPAATTEKNSAVQTKKTKK